MPGGDNDMRSVMPTTQPDSSQRLFPSGLKLTATLLLRHFNVLAKRPAGPAGLAAGPATAPRP